MFCFKLAQYNETNGLSFGKTTEITDDVKNALEKLQPGMLKTTTSVEGLAKSLGTTDQGFIKFCQSVKDGDIQIQQGQTYLQAYQAELKKTELSFKTIGTAAKGFFKNLGGKFVAGLGNILIGSIAGFLATSALQLIGKGFAWIYDNTLGRSKKEAKALEEMSQKADEAKSNIKSLQSEIKSNADTVDEAGKKYAELAQGVNQLTGKNISLSDDEYKEFLDVSNQLADVFPQLTKGYDDNGNAILDLQGNVDGITGKLQSLLEVEQQLAQQEIDKNLDTYFENQSKVFGKEAKGQNDIIDTQTEKIEKYQKALDHFNESVSNNKPASNFESELEKQTYYADFLADMEKANIDIADAIISQDGTSATEYNFAKLSKETKEQIRQYYAGIINTANSEIRSAESQLSTSNAEFASYVNMWMQNSSGSYLAMTGNDEMQSAFSSIVSGLNWGDILQGDDFSGLSGEELESAIETNILVPLQSAMANADTGDQFKQIITDALTISDDDVSLEESKNRIEAYVQEINDVLGDTLGKPLTASDLGMQQYLDNYQMLMDGAEKYANKFVTNSDKELSDAKRNLQDEYQKITDLDLDEYASKIKDKTVQTKFGNVDMDKRTIITWSDELKQTYKEALDSWDYDPEIGTIDTVFGASDRFGEKLNGEGWEVAFTPILPDGTFLSKDTVSEYINAILEKAYADDGKVTHSELMKIDAEGMKIGDTFVHGIYAAVDKSLDYENNGNWAHVTGRLTHFAGQDGAIQLAENAINSMTTLDKSKQSLIDFANKNSINTEAEIQTWNKIMSESNTREEAMQKYLQQKTVYDTTISFDPSTAYESMKNALSEQSSQGYLTDDTLKALKDTYGDLSDIILYTDTGIVLNTEHMAEYTENTAKAALVNTQLKEAFAVQEYNKEADAITDIINNEVKDTKTRNKLRSAMNKGKDALREEIKNLRKDNDGWSDNLSAHLDNISTLGDEINQYDALEQSIMASLSALNRYKQALETADYNDNFQYAQSQLQANQDAWDKGWTGTDDFQTYMEYIGSFNDEMQYSEALYQQYLTRAKKYLTEDISGLYTFLEDSSKVSDQIIKNADGTFKINVTDINALAEQMDMSVSMVTDILLAMKDATGIDISFDNIADSIVDGLHKISESSTASREDIESYREQIEALKKAGYDTTDLEEQLDAVAGSISPELEFIAKLADTDDLQKEAEEAASRISKNNKDLSINFNADMDVQTLENKLDQYKQYRDTLQVGSQGWEDAQTVIAQLLQQKQALETPAIMTVDVSGVEEQYQNVLAVVQSYINAKQQLEQAETLGIDTTEAENHLASVTTQLQNLQSQGELTKIGIDAEIDTDKFAEQIAALNPQDFIKDSDTSIKVDADTSAYDKAINDAVAKAQQKTAKIKIQAKLSENFHSNLQSILNSQTFNVKVNANASGTTVKKTNFGNTKTSKTVMFGGVRGTTAYADGVRNGQIAYDQKALVGEVAPELLVRDGQAQLIGRNGAEFMNLKKGDVIFNHLDTEKLLNGIGNVRGHLIGGGFVNGTVLSHSYMNAYINATGTATGWHGGNGSSGKSSSNNNGKGSSASDDAKEFEETLDWIEVKINRCEEAIARLNKTEENTFIAWTKRTSALNDEISKTTDEINWATQGYKRYLQQADSVALSESYKAKVRNGEINIEDITDEDLYNKIQDYQTWYEKAVELQDKIQELNISLSELAQKKFDNIVTQFEDMESEFTTLNDIINKLVDYAETKGRIISKSYYEAMLKNENENNKLLVQQRDQMVAELQDMLQSGRVTEYSEAWYDLHQKINDVNASIIDSNKSIQEFYNNIRQVDWDLFDLIQDKITGVADEIEFVQSLLEDRDNLTDGHLNRGLTNEGIAQLGNYASKYNIYMSQAEKYASEIKKIEADIAKDQANQDLIDRKEELVKAQRDVILSANDEKKSMIDLARQGYDAVLEVLQELIDKRKEYLDNEKSIYEYQQSIQEKTSNIAAIQKQIIVVENDNSEEAKKRIQQLQVDLKDAQQDLKDTEYDKYIDDQQKMLDDLYQEYSDKIDEKFEQTEILIQELIGVVNDNQGTISEVINTATSDVGYTISDQMKTIWSDAGTVISNFTGKFDTYATTVQSAINSIQVTIDNILKIAQAEANKNIATANNPSGVANNSNSSSNTASKPQTQAPTSAKNNTQSQAQAPKTASVGTRVNATGQWYYDSYGTAPTGNVNRFKPDYFEVDKVVQGRAYPYHIQAYIKGKKAGGNGWVKGNQIGYKTGLHRANEDHMALTQEEGTEIMWHNGAMLTPVHRDDMIFTHEMSENLWKIAQNNPEKFYRTAMPTMANVSTTNNGGDVSISIGDIKLDNVQNPDEFAKALIGVVKDYPKVQKLLQATTVDLVAGKSIKGLNRF